MSLLPSEPDTEDRDADPRVIGVDSEDADEVLAALSSETARDLLSALHDEPAPASRLAEEVDTSLQNAQYHLGKLQTAGAVEVVDTAYSEKGREMDVYAPAAEPLVIFAGGDDGGESTLRAALSRLLGAVGVLAAGSLAVQALVGRGGPFAPEVATGESAGGDGDEPAAGVASTPEPAPTPTDSGDQVFVQSVNETATEATRTAAETTAGAATPARTTAEAAGTPAGEVARTTAGVAGGLPPGLLFFAGGLVALAVVAAALAVR